MDYNLLPLLPLGVGVVVLICVTIFTVLNYKKHKKLLAELIAKLDALSSRYEEIEVGKFIESYYEQGLNKKDKNYAGCYIVYNPAKGIYYVGQSDNVFIRAKNHFDGKGSRDVYFDYNHGDVLTIKFIPLEGSGYDKLNDLERDFIGRYKAYYKGYNRTRGNH